MKKLFLIILLLSFSIPVSAQSDRFLLLEDENAKYFLDTVTYTVERDEEGKIEEIDCDIFVLYNATGSKKFAEENATFISSLQKENQDKTFDTVNINYKFTPATPEETQILQIEFLASNKILFNGEFEEKDTPSPTLQGIDFQQLLDRAKFYIEAQYSPPTNKRLLFLEENAYSGKYLDIDSFKIARLISNNRQSLLVDMSIVEFPTKLGISDFVAQNTLNGKYQPYHEQLSFYKYNYLIDPIDKKFLQGNRLYQYKDGSIEAYPAKSDWQDIEEQSFENGLSSKLALLYAMNYDESLQNLSVDVQQVEQTTKETTDSL